jgi:hypothetical protein
MDMPFFLCKWGHAIFNQDKTGKLYLEEIKVIDLEKHIPPYH